MADKDRTYISREIWPSLLIIALLAVLAQHFFGTLTALPLWGLFILLAYGFRDPNRRIPSQPLAIISPVDGRIVAVDTLPNPYIAGDSIRIRIQMNRTGSYRIRSPIEGKVMQRWFLLPGDPLPQLQGAIGLLHISNWIQTDEGEDIIISMRRDIKWFSPHCNIQTGERIGQGQRCGIIPFGSHVDLYIPVNSVVTQETGARLQAGSDVLGYLRHALA